MSNPDMSGNADSARSATVAKKNGRGGPFPERRADPWRSDGEHTGRYRALRKATRSDFSCALSPMLKRVL